MITKLLFPIAGMALAVSMVNARAADPIALTGSQMDAITAGAVIITEITNAPVPLSSVGRPVITIAIGSPPGTVVVTPAGNGTPTAGQDSASISGPNNTGANARATGDVVDASVSNQGGTFTAIATSTSTESISTSTSTQSR